MKFKILLLLLFITLQNYSQISVGPTHVGKSKKFKKDVLEKFKNTETIFLLSNVYDKEIYEQILKSSWTVTPYRIIEHEEFNLNDYLSDKYSIAEISGYIKSQKSEYGGGTIVSLYTFFDIKMYDNGPIKEQRNKLTAKKWEKKKKKIFAQNSFRIARFYLYPKDDFFEIAVPYSGKNKNNYEGSRLTIKSPEYMNSVINALYSKEVFFNYKPGLLKNYFQKVNSLIKKEEVYWMYEDDYMPELRNLANKKLYIPSYMTIKYNGWSGKDSEPDEDNILEIFKKYDYQYEIISDKDLSNRIMNNEEFYYLRYVRMNAERFLQVVNSRTGEIIYKNYITGLSYKIKPKHIKDLNSKITKALKK